MTVIDAPAGFGKTTLLHDALDEDRRDGRSVTWRRGTAEVTLADIVSDASMAGPVTVAIDDAQNLPRVVLEELADRLGELPPGVRVVLAGRALTWPGLNRQAVHGAATYIDADDLAFTDAELDAVQANGWATGGSLEISGMARWPAVAQLVAHGDNDRVVAYLRDEVVPELDDGLVRLIAAVGTVGDASRDAVVTIVEVLDLPPAAASALDRFPLVRRAGTAVVVDRVWAGATMGALSAAEGRAVCRAIAQLDRRRGLLTRAAELSIRARDADGLADIASDALGVQPPLVPMRDLEVWLASGLLDGPIRDWIAGTVDGLHAPTSASATEILAASRSGFERIGDTQNEVGAMLALGQHARRCHDLGTVLSLLPRAEALAASGDERATVLACLGRALAAQMAGDPGRALVELDRTSPRSMVGDWAAQIDMVRATNLLLLGRSDAAIIHFERASGLGSAWSRGSALDLLSHARWLAGDRVGAHRDADAAVRLVSPRHLPGLAAGIRAARACLIALDGGAPADEAPVLGPGSPLAGGEASLLWRVVSVVEALGVGDEDLARDLLTTVEEPPARAMRSSSILATLDVGLGTDRAGHWHDVASIHHALEAPVTAGVAAAAFLAGGPEPASVHDPYLPMPWRGARRATVWLRLCGRGEVWRGSALVEHPRWARDRVRELCLHLALVPDASRSDRASALWPDLSPDRAVANLRVTLSQLLDVLDPDRVRGGGSSMVQERNNSLTIITGMDLLIDVREVRDLAKRVVQALDAGEDALAVTAARRVVDLVDHGTTLGGGDAGEWVERHQRAFDELVVRALRQVGPVALALGEHELAEHIGSLALEIDPWAETSARLVVQARLAGHDLDGARRALAVLVTRLAEIEVPPQPETRDLFAQIGRPIPHLM